MDVTMLSPVDSYTLYSSNEGRQIRNVESCQKYMCTASKSSPLIKSPRQLTKLFSSDEKKCSSKPRHEYGYNKKYCMDPEPELTMNKIKYHEAHNNDGYFIKPRTQSSINISQTMIYVNKSCRSLASLLNSQQLVTIPCRSSSSSQKQRNKPQRVNGSVNDQDYSYGNQKMLKEKNKRTNGKVNRKINASTGETMPEIPTKKIKQVEKIPKRKPTIFTYNVKCNNSGKLLQMCCYKKTKVYENENVVHPIKIAAANVNEEHGISTKKRRRNKRHCTYSNENTSLLCHDRDYIGKNKTTTAIIPSLDLVQNDHHVGYKQFSNKHVTGKVSKTLLLQRIDHRSREICNSTFTDKLKSKKNARNNYFCSDNINGVSGRSTHMLLATVDKEENRKLFDDLLEDYGKTAGDENVNLSKLFTPSINQHNVKLLTNFSTKTASNSEENYNVSSSLIDKFKQQIVKVAEKITPKDINQDHKSVNGLIIDEIKQHDILKLFNISFIKNTSKPHKEKRTNRLAYSKLNSGNSLPKINCEPHNLCVGKSKQQVNLSPNKRIKISDVKTMKNGEVKQKESITLYTNFLVDNSDNAFKESKTLNKHMVFPTNQQKTRKLFHHLTKGTTDTYDKLNTLNSIQSNAKPDTSRPAQDKLSLKKAKASIRNPNGTNTNKYLIKVNSKSNYELNTTSKFPTISGLKIKNIQQCTKSATTPKLLSEEKKTEAASLKSSSMINIPYVISVKSVQKIKMDKVRFNSKFTLKNNLLQNDRIYYSSKRIKRQMEELGMQNVLCTSLPVKYCTTTELNEHSQVDLPYQVSLKSLPLGAIDTNIVNKLTVKHRKSTYDDFHNSKLNYYSNLETSFKGTPKNTYEVRYFELSGNSQPEDKSAPSTNKTTGRNKTSQTPEENTLSKNVSYSSDNKSLDKTVNTSSEYSKHGPPWRQSFEVRVLEYVPQTSDTDLPMAMSKARGASTPGTSKSKYYGYPDDEEYMRTANRRTMADRRLVEDYPRMTNRKTVERRAEFAHAPHQHGESRLGMEPWAPFSISDTSLPRARRARTNQPNYSPYPGSEIPTSSLKSANGPPRNKESEMSNQSRVTGGGPTPLQNVAKTDAGLNPVFLTSELLEKITRAIDSDRLPRYAEVNPLFRNTNFGRGGYDLPVQVQDNKLSDNASCTINRFTCCPIQMCTVSTNTDDVYYEFPRKGIIGSQQKQSSCIQCDLSHLPFQKANRTEFTKKISQRACTKQSARGKICTTGQPSASYDHHTDQFKQTPESDTGRQACKCGLSQDLCLCSYLCKCGTNIPYGNEVTDQHTTNFKANQQTKNTSNCFKSYNPNPRVMYYLGDQRNNFFETESDSSSWKDQSIIVENIQQKSDLPCKLSASSEYVTKDDKIIASTDTGTAHAPKQHSIIGQNSKVKNVKIQQVQYCLDDPANMKNISFRPKINHPMVDTSKNKISVGRHEVDLDNYYLLCLPNESALNKGNIFHEKCELECLPHTKLIISNNKPPQVLDLVYKACYNQNENISNTLNAHSNPKSSCTGEKSVRSKEAAESNKAVGQSSDLCSDSTIYVFQTEPKLDRTKNSIVQTVLIENTNTLGTANEPFNEKVAVNQTSNKFQNKDLLTQSMKDKKTVSQSNRFPDQMDDKVVEGHRYCLTEREKNPDEDIRNGSNTFVQMYKELETLTDDCKCKTTLTDSGHNQSRIMRSFACHQNDTLKNSSENKQPLEISRDVVNENVNEQFSMRKHCNIGDLKYSGNSSTYETFFEDVSWTKHFDPAVTSIVAEVLTNKINEENKLKNKRSAATVKKENHHISNSLAEDNSKEIPIGDGTSKYSIIISQLADAPTSSIQNSCILSPLQCSGDATDKANQTNRKGKRQSIKHCVDTTAECDHSYCDDGKLFKHFSKGTQSPPVIYRSKLTDFVKISIPSAEFPNKLKLERKAESCDLMSQPSKNYNENELDHESCTNTAVKCVCGGLPIYYHARNKRKIEKTLLLEEQPPSNISNNIQNTIKNNDDNQCEAFVQYVDTSQQTEDLNSKVRCSSQLLSNMDNKENSSSVNKKPILSNEALKTERRISNTVVQKSPVSQDSNSEIFTEAYKSKLLLCDSWLRFPLQLENQNTIFCKNPFPIPPDYDESEFNVQASNSRHSNCETFKDNNDSNNGKYLQTSTASKIELSYSINKSNIGLHRSSSTNLRKHSKDTAGAFDGLREEYQKPPFHRIVPVALAVSQEECREVSSDPMTPVVLAISQQDYKKVAPSAPTMLSANDVHPIIDFLPNHSVTTNGKVNICSARTYQEMNFDKPLSQDVTKQCRGDSQDCNQYNGSTAFNYNEQHILDTVDTEFNKNSDKIYWALTKVKTHRDGSHDFEILETTPIPPGHFLISTANSVVLVGNQPCISDENKEVNHK